MNNGTVVPYAIEDIAQFVMSEPARFQVLGA